MASEAPRATSRCQPITLGRVDERRGSLCVAEVGQHIPFQIERAFWIFDVPEDAERARHAHREQSEVLVAVRGAFTVHCDDGSVRSVYTLDSPNAALLLPPMVFHELDGFARGSVCLVLSSGPYDPHEFVTEYDEFRELTAGW